MTRYSTDMYDTAAFTNVAGEFLLFQVSQGSDATHTENFTNSRGAGQIPQNESFTVKWIGAIIDFNGVVADVQNVPISSFIEIRVNEITVLKVPLARIMARSSYSGHYTQATAADESLIGLEGNGYMLETPIVIKGGVSFKVRVVQGTALSTTGRNVKIVLGGELETS